MVPNNIAKLTILTQAAKDVHQKFETAKQLQTPHLSNVALQAERDFEAKYHDDWERYIPKHEVQR